MGLTGFAGEPIKAKGIMSKEFIVGSKMLPMPFFIVDAKGCYNVLFGHDWIHANGCIPSTLHQCVMQWVGNQVEVIEADDMACVAATDAQVDVQGGIMSCPMRRDLTEYDYMSVRQDGFVPISVKLMMNVTQLAGDMV
jgi:hypothetical protein